MHGQQRPYPGTVTSASNPGTLEAVLQTLAGRTMTVLTGAGISTDSGIPDYRGPLSPPRTPMTYQQFVGDPDFRRHYWARNHVGWRHVHRQSPNGGHRALVALEAAGVVNGVITQNVDRLHTLAGSRCVVDLHGTYARVLCLACGHPVTRAELAVRLEAMNPEFAAVHAVGDAEIAPDADAVLATTEGFRVADCDRCGGMLKPDIVYFGENVPKPRVAEAYALVDAADALLVVGSSLTVMSGLRFVRHVVRNNSARANVPVVILNRGWTRGDELATVKLDAGCTETLTALAATLGPARASA